MLNNLTHLWCSNCPSLTNIPILNKLTHLWCFDCPSLTNISILNNLMYLQCLDCNLLTNIPIVINTKIDNCKWLNHSDTQLNQLIKSQRIVKRYLNRRKFVIRLDLNKYMPLVLINIIKK